MDPIINYFYFSPRILIYYNLKILACLSIWARSLILDLGSNSFQQRKNFDEQKMMVKSLLFHVISCKESHFEQSFYSVIFIYADMWWSILIIAMNNSLNKCWIIKLNVLKMACLYFMGPSNTKCSDY